MRGGTAQGPDRTGMLTARCIGVMFFAGGFPGACLARVDISLGHWGRQGGQGGRFHPEPSRFGRLVLGSIYRVREVAKRLALGGNC